MKIYHDIPDNKDLFKNPAVTIGNFDGVHIGHLKILSALIDVSNKISGDAVAVTFSSHPRKILYPHIPLKIITTTEEKINAIYNSGISNIILLNFTKEMSEMRAEDFYNKILIKKLDIKEIVLGSDHAFGKNREGNRSFLNNITSKTETGITIVEPATLESKHVSSTWLRKEIENGNISTVTSLLGRHYSINGRVVKGAGRGAGLGFPTANIIPETPDKIVPLDGVYAVSVIINSEKKIGMLNIGINPTFSQNKKTIEVNIFDFNENIYDSEITVEFMGRLRQEIKFETKKALVKQMKADRNAVLDFMKSANE